MSSELSFRGGATSAILTIRPSVRARVMRLRVDPRTGAVVLTVPPRVSRRRALDSHAGLRGIFAGLAAEQVQRLALQPAQQARLQRLQGTADQDAPRFDPGRARALRTPIDRVQNAI